LEIYCDDHSLISSTPAVQNMNYFIYTTHYCLLPFWLTLYIYSTLCFVIQPEDDKVLLNHVFEFKKCGVIS